MNIVNKKTNEYVDGYVDSIKFRIDFIDKEYREKVYVEIMNFIKEKRLVAMQYDKVKSNQYCQITNLNSSNTTIASISKNAYTHSHIKQYTISIAFFGLKRYNKKLDDKSMLLLQNIVAYLNTNKIDCSLGQIDLASDIKCSEENLLVLPVKRGKKQYYSLGKYDEQGNRVQEYEGTYEIEKFTKDNDMISFTIEGERRREISKRKKNVMKLMYWYNKRKKEIDKAKSDIGFDVWRCEMKLQNRWFLKNEVSVNSFLQEMKKYKMYYFEDTKQKEIFIKKYNKANSNKHRTKLIEILLEDTTVITTKMQNIGTFLRMIDTIKFDAKGQFLMTSKEDYLYGLSKFNRKK